jgi:hypothetical protein
MTAALVCALAFTGCSNQSDEKAAPATETKPAAQVAAPADDDGHGHTAAEHDALVQTQNKLSGTIVETFDSGGYTYIQLDNGSEKIWGAVGQTKVAVGDKVTLRNGPVMTDFHSKTLDRTFPQIIFSAGLVEDGGAASPHGSMMGAASGSFADAMQQEAPIMGDGSMPGMVADMQQSGGSGGAITPLQAVQVDKAEGENAHTVEEMFTTSADLAGTKVKIRGKVVKVSPNIMGRNWVHLQDGTGDAKNNTHDLVITSAEIPEIDSIVVMEGVMAKDKDFGAGYFYNVIVEEAVISK